jgi:hypothetical protein
VGGGGEEGGRGEGAAGGDELIHCTHTHWAAAVSLLSSTAIAEKGIAR